MCEKIYSLDDIKSALNPVFVKHNVKKAVLFGSYVKGLADSRSDVDLLLNSGLKGLEFVGLIETHIIPDSKILSEISKDGVVIYEE